MLRVLILALLNLVASISTAADLEYYLGTGSEYTDKVPTPESFLGFEIGTRHLYHHQVLQYCEQLAKRSPRVKLIEYARTHGDRPLFYLLITSPENHRKIEEIRSQHILLAKPDESASLEIDAMPAVVWMGYGVHGNEPSATNAAPLIAYHLAAAKGPEVTNLLRNSVILLDPCLNPDGFERFAHWANNYRGIIANPDPQHREHRESSPTGRTNYYWFDLNRDWLPAQQPESQGRLEVYHQWLPNVVLDYHEMGGDSTYFFQPGVPSRMHPITPASNLELTRRFAKYHARALDEIGSLYYTEERFDDFYMGKGSTYPDLHGGVGILFEQASARGQKQTNSQGELEFHFAIRNQVRTSLSSLQATFDHRLDLLKHQRDFYQESLALGSNAEHQGFVFSAGDDAARADEFLSILLRHRIKVHLLSQDVEVGGQKFQAANSYGIPAAQPEYRFLLAMTECRKEFKDKVFYDISAWSLPLAFDLDWQPITGGLPDEWFGELIEFTAPEEAEEASASDEAASPHDEMQEAANVPYAYFVKWDQLFAPRLLARLLQAGVRVRVAQSPFRIESEDGMAAFDYGTLMIPLGIQMEKHEEIKALLDKAVDEDLIAYSSARTGLTAEGVDLGSSTLTHLSLPKALLVVGVGTDDYEAGEVWHYFDQKLGLPLTLCESHLLSTTKLEGYSTIILVSGTYGLVNDAGVERLTNWVRGGGTLISLGTATRWLTTKKLTNLKVRSAAGEAKAEGVVTRLPYASADDQAALQKVEGTIFNTEIDRTHPLCFGIQGTELPVFRDHAMFLEPSSNPYSTPAVYTRMPLLSGYASQENQLIAGGSAALVFKSEGNGRVIAIPNNPNFRGFWLGSQKLFVNSLFFGSIVREP